MSTDVRSDVDDIREIHEAFIEANRIADTDWCRTNMVGGEEGVVLFNTNGSNYLGVEHWCRLWDFYRDHIRGDKRTGGQPPIFESVGPRFRVNGDVAWVTYRLRMVGKIDGVPLPENARGTEIYERADGTWKMVHGHWSIGDPGGPADGN